MQDIPAPSTLSVSDYMGSWAMEPVRFNGAVQEIKGYIDAIRSGTGFHADEHDEDEDKLREDLLKTFQVTRQGVAIVPIDGVMMKGFSFFGGNSTVFTRMQLRAALASSDVKSILLTIDSPGGHVAGTEALAEDIRQIDAIKPVFAQVEDLAASAALWVASQARFIAANSTALVGSIGVFQVIDDMSEMVKDMGITVHVISTGPNKGAFVQGAEVTDEQLAAVQEEVDDTNELFIAAIARGRGLSVDRVEESADGRVFIAAKALDRGLIDAVQSIDDTIAQMMEEAGRRTQARRHRAQLNLEMMT